MSRCIVILVAVYVVVVVARNTFGFMMNRRVSYCIYVLRRRGPRWRLMQTRCWRRRRLFISIQVYSHFLSSLVHWHFFGKRLLLTPLTVTCWMLRARGRKSGRTRRQIGILPINRDVQRSVAMSIGPGQLERSLFIFNKKKKRGGLLTRVRKFSKVRKCIYSIYVSYNFKMYKICKYIWKSANNTNIRNICKFNHRVFQILQVICKSF